jgi:hypothetical protein
MAIINEDVQPKVREALEPNETLRVSTQARQGTIEVTDRRILVLDGDRIALNVPFGRLRRLQLDIERNKMATIVVVPEHPEDEPQVLSIPEDQYANAVEVMVEIGRHIAMPIPGGDGSSAA